MSTWAKAFKGYLTPKIFLFLFLGFSCGITPLLLDSTLSLWLTKKQWPLEQIGFLGVITLPYSFKYIWAPIIDNIRIPFFSNHLGAKKTWGILFQIGLMLSLIIFALTVQNSGSLNPQIYVIGFLCAFYL